VGLRSGPDAVEKEKKYLALTGFDFVVGIPLAKSLHH
jgi:hypothetical protein